MLGLAFIDQATKIALQTYCRTKIFCGKYDLRVLVYHSTYNYNYDTIMIDHSFDDQRTIL